MTVDEITTTAALEALGPEWSELWARTACATPFQAPQWLIPWWKHLGRGELWTLALRCRGRLRGVVPLWIDHSEPAGRSLLLLGTGITDYLDALVETEFEAGALAAIAGHLAGRTRRWDRCEFHQLPAGALLLRLPGPAGWPDRVEAQDACPVLAFSADGWQSVPGHQRANLRYYRRRAERLGALRVERAGPGNLDELLAALLRLHRARWAARWLPGVLAEGSIQNFHREAAAGLLALGVLRLYGLCLGERRVASFYGFTAKRRAYYYLGGFDPAWERLSLGTLIIGHAIEEALREQAGEFHFLRGREGYKYLWGARDRLNCLRRLECPARRIPANVKT